MAGISMFVSASICRCFSPAADVSQNRQEERKDLAQKSFHGSTVYPLPFSFHPTTGLPNLLSMNIQEITGKVSESSSEQVSDSISRAKFALK